MSALLLISCGEDSESGLEPGFIGIEVTPHPYEGVAGKESHDTIWVTVTDHNSRIAAGVRISFGPVYSYATGSLEPDATGRIRALSQRTDANGQVRAVWTFARKAGYQLGSVIVADMQRESFPADVLPDSARTVTLTPPAGPLVAGTTYNIPIRAEDVYGNEILLVSWQVGAIPNRRPVNWTVSNPTVLTLDSLGRASLQNAGTTNVTAEVEGVTATIPLSVVDADAVGADRR